MIQNHAAPIGKTCLRITKKQDERNIKQIYFTDLKSILQALKIQRSYVNKTDRNYTFFACSCPITYLSSPS